MTTTDTTPDLSLSPAAIDSTLATLWHPEQEARFRLARGLKAIERATGRLLAHYQEEQETLTATVASLREQAAPYEAEFVRRGGWSRFFLVLNDNGHVHRERSCSTCRWSTEYAWLPHLSGATEQEMVEQYGEMACTVCFPSAPAMRGFGDGTSVVARATATEKAERQAEKAAKAADKLAKALSPSGLPVRIGRERLTTIVAGERFLSQCVQNFGWYGPEHPDRFQVQAALVRSALVDRGISQERITGIINRAADKARKEGGAHDVRTA